MLQYSVTSQTAKSKYSTEPERWLSQHSNTQLMKHSMVKWLPLFLSCQFSIHKIKRIPKSKFWRIRNLNWKLYTVLNHFISSLFWTEADQWGRTEWKKLKQLWNFSSAVYLKDAHSRSSTMARHRDIWKLVDKIRFNIMRKMLVMHLIRSKSIALIWAWQTLKQQCETQ